VTRAAGFKVSGNPSMRATAPQSLPPWRHATRRMKNRWKTSGGPPTHIDLLIRRENTE
jgi:hypothetical protein